MDTTDSGGGARSTSRHRGRADGHLILGCAGDRI